MDTWNTQKIIADHGGPQGLQRMLEVAGHNVTLPVVRAWAKRDNIPGHWIAPILMLNGENPRGWITEDIF